MGGVYVASIDEVILSSSLESSSLLEKVCGGKQVPFHGTSKGLVALLNSD